MIPFQVKSEIAAIEQLDEDVFRFTVLAPRIAKASLPGQFVMIRVGEGYDPLLRRPFSIHNVQVDRGEIQVLFKVLGKGTRMLAALTAGREIDMIGPLGKGFTVMPDLPACLIGGGMGAAPLYFLASRMRHQNHEAELTVLLGSRTASELEVLARDFQKLGIRVHQATDDGSAGHHGLVTDLLAQAMTQGERAGSGRAVYSCGPFPMMRAVAAQCRKNGWNCQVSLETMMACGVSACLGCVVPKAQGQGYLHVCQDGPVFEAGEVEWR